MLEVSNMESKWLTWAKELQSIAQAGEHYSKDKFQQMYRMHIFLLACCLSFEKLLGDENMCI